MDIKVAAGDIARASVPAIIVNLFEGVKKPGGATGAVDTALGGAITQLIADGELKGKLNEVVVLHTLGRIPSARVAIVGLGKQVDFTLDRVRQASSAAVRHLRGKGVSRAATIVHGAGIGGLDATESAQAVAEGTLLGLYAFRKHKKPPEEDSEFQELTVLEQDASRVAQLEAGVARARIIAEATNLARDLSNEPANAMMPADLAAAAKQVALSMGLEIEVLEKAQIQAQGMGGLLGVNQGSHHPPVFIVMRYRSPGATHPHLGLVGKGITFDSGGISLKPADGMQDMKSDKSGAAAVIAAMGAIARLKPRLCVTGLAPVTENLPGGGAMRPGDIIRIMNGKTVEVISTDAEGRLILADALCYGRQIGLSHMVDCATLTGACHVALGDLYSGAFTNNQGFLDQVLKAAEQTGDRLWPLPMPEEYKDQYRSDDADIKNVGGRYGGAITAAEFLGEFAGDTPWVHLDIAGPARLDKDHGYLLKGATGVPTRTLVQLALNMAAQS